MQFVEMDWFSSWHTFRIGSFPPSFQQRSPWRNGLAHWTSRSGTHSKVFKGCGFDYHMSRVGFYGEDQSEALKRHVVLSHTTSWSITRVRLTSDLPVPSAPEIFQSAMWYGIIPAWVVLCHTTWLENRNENGLWKAVSTCGIPKSVRMKMSLTSSNDSRHCKRKSLKFWSKNAFHKKRRGPPTRSGRWERSFTERDLQTPHCLPFD